MSAAGLAFAAGSLLLAEGISPWWRGRRRRRRPAACPSCLGVNGHARRCPQQPRPAPKPGGNPTRVTGRPGDRLFCASIDGVMALRAMDAQGLIADLEPDGEGGYRVPETRRPGDVDGWMCYGVLDWRGRFQPPRSIRMLNQNEAAHAAA